jgi:hypothetical protein
VKLVTIHSTWKATATNVEVPDDFSDDLPLEEWPEDVLEQVNSGGAYLADWEVFGE